MTNSILKINKITTDKQYSWKNLYDVTILNLDVNVFTKIDWFDDSSMMGFLELPTDQMRPATEDEIKLYNFILKKKRYNVI